MKEYILPGLDCPNCAAAIEKDLKKMEGVIYASVNFVTATLRIEAAGGNGEELLKNIERIVHRHEPDVPVREKVPAKREESGKEYRAGTIRTFVGAAFLAAGIAAEQIFGINGYMTPALFVLAYLLTGGGVLLRAVRNITRGKIFDENLLMAVATIGAFALGEYAEAVAVMLFFQVGEYFQGSAVRKSKRTIAGLMDIRPDTANLRIGYKVEKVAPASIGIGDIIIVKPGERIPLDGLITEGEAALDTSALTGESLPRMVRAGDKALSGCVNQNGLLTIKVTQTFGSSTASRIIDLVENAAAKKAPTESFITKFARYYTPAVTGLAALIAIVPPLLTGSAWSVWLSRGLIFLVISCPCALVISIPLGFFGGIGCASRRGILIKGGNYLEALNELDTVVFDKTGTLTKGVFKVTAIKPANGFCETGLLEAAAKAEAFSNHPIALSVLKEYGKAPDRTGLKEYREIAGQGVSVKAAGTTILAGNQKLLEHAGITCAEEAGCGTKVYVAVNGVFGGCLTISDEIKKDSPKAVAALKALGVRKTVMLTGDDPQIALAVAGELGIDEAFGGLLPQGKVEKLELLAGQKRPGGKLAFVGDGINDAPALAMADIGVAMGGLGSDAALEAADVALMTDEPSKLAEAIEIARFTRRVVWQNIIFALGVKAVFLLLGALGAATMWAAVFADVGVALLAILNAMRAMRM